MAARVAVSPSAASMAMSHSVSKPVERLFRLVEPARSITSSMIVHLAWTMTVFPASVSGQKAWKRPCLSAPCSRRIRAERVLSMVMRSNQLGLCSVETTTTSGPSASPSRAASASPIAGEATY